MITGFFFSYIFTGKLRPAEYSAKREVPDTIPRPDYADHPEGYPLSEMKLKELSMASNPMYLIILDRLIPEFTL